MSLQGNYKHGYTDYPNAYYSIVESSDLRDKQRIIVGIWADEASYNADKADNGIATQPLDIITYESENEEYENNFSITEQDKAGKNPRQQAYEILKTKEDLRGVDFTKLTDK